VRLGKPTMTKPVWDKYLAKLGDGWSVFKSGMFREGDEWRVFISDDEDPILCEKFADDKIERLAYFDQGWVVTQRDARISPRAMRALLDAWYEQ
jgi:hypothetical protein